MAGRLFDRDGLDSPAAREKAVRPPEPPATVTAFLGRLTLLHGVPFPYLVPDARLLPAESLKIFLIDPRWLDALVGGALGVGRGGTTRLLLDKAQAGDFCLEQVNSPDAYERQDGQAQNDDPHAAYPVGKASPQHHAM